MAFQFHISLGLVPWLDIFRVIHFSVILIPCFNFMLFFTSEITSWIIQYKQTALCLRTCYLLRFCVTLPVLHFTHHAIIRPISNMRSNTYLLTFTGRLGFYRACLSHWLSRTKYLHEVVARHYVQTSFTLAKEHRLIDYKSHQFCTSRRNLFYTQWSIILSIWFFVSSGKSHTKTLTDCLTTFHLLWVSEKIASKHTVC